MTLRTSTNPQVSAEWTLRPAAESDFEAVLALKNTVMRADLERLGRFDEDRSRARVRASFSPLHTSVIELDGAFAGSLTLRDTEAGRCLENFYLAPDLQGRGLGTAILRAVLDAADAEGVPMRLTVLQGSAARRLYERHGFTVESEDAVDVTMVRVTVVRAG
ncbi:GNAT family N-acetyltransferase [Streptomyces sp. NPDC059009]|uniref:GNAT family N-acetyltransferase n=1 Tax=Streptomyces sp. NPDC059009 TaxID=3346694 RepID=UPI00367383FF